MSMNFIVPDRGYADKFEPCQLIGATHVISGILDTAVIFHGVGGCRTMMEFSRVDNVIAGCPMMRIYPSNVTQSEIVYGGRQKLQQCIDQFLPDMKRRQLKLIWLVTSCATSMVGDDIVGPAQWVEKATGSKVVPMDIPGFQGGLCAGADKVYARLVEHFADRNVERIKGSINIIGPQLMGSRNWPFDLDEMVRLLEAADIKVNLILTCRTNVEDIKRFAQAEANYVLTPEEMPEFSRISAELGVENWGADVVLPIGMANTEEWYIKIVSRFGNLEKAKETLEKDADMVRKRLRGDYLASWVFEDSFSKSVGVTGYAPFAAAVARYLFYDLNMRPRVVGILSETQAATDTARALLEEISPYLDFDVYDNPTHLEYGNAIKDWGVTFTIGMRHDRVLSEGIGIPQLPWGGFAFMNQTNFVPWPTYGVRGALSLMSDIAVILERVKNEMSGWRGGSFIAPIGEEGGCGFEHTTRRCGK